MANIDRRAGPALSGFLHLDPERYTSLDSYRSPSAEFRACCRRLLPADWKVGEEPGVWCYVQPPSARVPDSGFKIHLSTVPDRALELLERVIPVLVDERASFKVLVDARILDLSNSHMWARGACGKFITIYPADSGQFARLMQRLHAVTGDFSGPYILSDRRLKDSRVLFYRYGAFLGAQRLNAYGEQENYLRTADGRLLRDRRPPFFVLPEGIVDPFPAPAPRPANKPPLIHERYQALATLGTSAKGGVYRCLDSQTQREVILKEARPHVNRRRNHPHDAVAGLHNEWKVLQVLADTGLTPRPLDFFQEWEHSFLVMERVRGRKLSRLIALGEVSLVARQSTDAEELRRYGTRFLALARKLITAVRAVHARGVVLQDLSPNNILVDEEDGLTLIDFEAALDPQDPRRAPPIPLFTPGFGAPLAPGETPTVAGDQRALSRILGEFIYPSTPFFTLGPGHRRPMFEHFAREKGIPDAFVRLVFAVEEQPAQVDALLEEAERSLEDVRPPVPRAPLRDEGELRRVLGRIEGYIREQSARGTDPLDLPMDYRRWSTHRLGAAYGASGIALFLHRTRGGLPTPFLDALRAEASRLDAEHSAPGLQVGSAGVAWTLLELGQTEEARRMLEAADRSPLRLELLDLFYGAAGVGLTHLFFFSRLGDRHHLDAAHRLFEELEPRLRSAERGRYFETEGEVYHGLAHGSSGVAWFLLQLYRAGGRAEVLECARALLEHDLASGELRDGTPHFARSRGERVTYPYWKMGAVGIGCVALRFHEALGEPAYLEHARAIAAAQTGLYSVFPCHYMGMTGLAGFLVDMHQRTGEESYRTEALRYVDRIMLFALERPEGLVFPGEELVRVSTDLGTGSAGTGLLLQRLLDGGGIPYFDF